MLSPAIRNHGRKLGASLRTLSTCRAPLASGYKMELTLQPHCIVHLC